MRERLNFCEVHSSQTVKKPVAYWPKLTWVMDARNETNLVPISTLPMPPLEVYGRKGGCFGSQ